MSEHTTDITDALTPETPTSKKLRKGTTAVFLFCGVLLLIDDQVRRFSRKRSVKVTVADKPDN